MAEQVNQEFNDKQVSQVNDKDSSDDEEDKMSESESKLWNKIEELLRDYHLNSFSKLACKKFIKDKVGDPKNTKVERLREWLFMKINGQRIPEKHHPR